MAFLYNSTAAKTANAPPTECPLNTNFAVGYFALKNLTNSNN